MLEGAHMTPGNRYKYKIFIDHGLVNRDGGGHKILFISIGGPCKSN